VFEWFGMVSYCPHTKVAEFARHLKDGRLMGSLCGECGYTTFPPRADCPQCLSEKFSYVEMGGEGVLVTFTRIEAVPAGFEDVAPFICGVIDLKECGRLLAWFGETIPEHEIEIGMQVQVVPRIFEELEEIKVYYTLEKPGAAWVKSDSA